MILLFLCGIALAVVPTVRQHSPVVITQKRVITTALCCRVAGASFRPSRGVSTHMIENAKGLEAIAVGIFEQFGGNIDARLP